jgi:hypothetical protein
MSDDLPAWYFEKAAHRARLEMLEYERTSPPAVPAPDPVDEAMKISAELSNAGRLN